jgi:hypothetical protein
MWMTAKSAPAGARTTASAGGAKVFTILTDHRSYMITDEEFERVDAAMRPGISVLTLRVICDCPEAAHAEARVEIAVREVVTVVRHTGARERSNVVHLPLAAV